MDKKKDSFYERHLKRRFDVLGSLLILILLSPVILITALLVRIELGSPIIFKQQRPGKINSETGKERIFTLYKFRSMADKYDERGYLLPDEERLNRFGRLLRSSSLDELPELINILKGDMSMVGPRPLSVKYLPYYTEKERIRHMAMPGLTGLAQINGRNDIGWEERFFYDSQYVNHITFCGDVKIILVTIYKVFSRKDITVRGEGNIQDFDVERRKVV